MKTLETLILAPFWVGCFLLSGFSQAFASNDVQQCIQSLTSNSTSVSLDSTIVELTNLLLRSTDASKHQGELIQTKYLELSKKLGQELASKVFIEVQNRVYKALHKDYDNSTSEAKASNEPPRNQVSLKVYTARPLIDFKRTSDYYIKHYSFSPDGSKLLVSYADETAILWDTTTGQQVQTLTPKNPISTPGFTSGSFSPNGEKIIISTRNKTNFVLSAKDGTTLFELTSRWGWGFWGQEGHSTWINQAIFSPDSQSIVTAGGDHLAKIWDANNGKLKFDLVGHTSAVHGVAYSPNGLSLVTGSHDGIAKVWDTRTGQNKMDLLGHKGPIFSVSYSNNGSFIATASEDHLVKIWDAQKGTLLYDLPVHASNVHSVKFSPDDQYIISSSSDHTVKIWDLKSKRLVISVDNQSGFSHGALFSPDGTRFVTSIDDHTVRLWSFIEKYKQPDDILNF